MLTIDIETARRFILGKQGYGPGGAGAASRARSRPCAPWSTYSSTRCKSSPAARTSAAQPRARLHAWHVGGCAYQQRKFFDWGGWLAVRPMDELPYWRVVMRREREGTLTATRAFRKWAASTPKPSMKCGHHFARARHREQPRLRDGGAPNQSYRGRKDSALALYYLWRTGEVMTHHRENFERVYALTETVAPASPWRKQRSRGGPLLDPKGNQLLRPVAAEPHAGFLFPRHAFWQSQSDHRGYWPTAKSSR
jgi:uncharacterized protein